MKKIFLFFVVLCLIGINSFAQLSGGLKAGLNLATQKWELSGESDKVRGTSFHVGGYLNQELGNAFSLQPELLYNSLKFSESGDDMTLSYLSLPLMFVYGFSDERFNLQAGPQMGFLIATDPSEIKDEDIYKGTDISLNVGAGGNFDKFNITVRYCIGLSNSDNLIGKTLGISDLSIKNSNFQISMGFKLFGE